MCPTDPSTDFSAVKRMMRKPSDSGEKPGAVRTLTLGVLWCLDAGVSDSLLLDLVELLRFEVARRRAEGGG